MAKGDFNTRRLDEGQLDLMFSFLRAGMVKPNIPALKEYCDQLRQAMIQKTAGQRSDDPDFYVEFGDIGTIINSIVIEAMALRLSGVLDKIEQDGGDKMDLINELSSRKSKLEDKHWEECRQIALYDDDLKKALALLRRVRAVHMAAIRNGDAAVSALTSRLLYDIDKLEGEI